MSYTCPRCGRTSHHPEDEANRYCGNCHRFENGALGLFACPCGRTLVLERGQVCERCGNGKRL